MNQDAVVVNLKIYNRSFKLKVRSEDESKVRSKAQECNALIEKFKKDYPGRDIQDYLSMYIIQMMDEQGQKHQAQDQQEVLDSLKELDALF